MVQELTFSADGPGSTLGSAVFFFFVLIFFCFVFVFFKIIFSHLACFSFARFLER